jgi:predicted MFS family arabinose efflux permease
MGNNKVRRDRPLGVTIVGVLLFLFGLFMILGGITVGTLADLEGLELAFEMVSLIIGIILIVIAFGFFKGWGFVWLLTMIVVIIGIIWNILTWVLDGMEMDEVGALLIGLIIPVIIVLYMNSSNVKTFFRRS